MFDKMDLFVYSGTGNTLKVAQCIAEAGKKAGVGSETAMIDRNAGPSEYKPSADRLLGLLAPTIGAIQPPGFFGFIFRLPKGNGQKVFLAGTGAWTKAGRIFLPGYVGFGLYLAALILIMKGFRIIGINGFGMPHNWTTLLPAYSKTLEARINAEIQPVAESFAQDLLSGKKVFKRIGDLVFTLLIFPLPFLFILFGRPTLAKSMFAGTNCSGCGLCAANCPRRAIRMVGKKKKQPYWTYKCEQCMRCAGYCPEKAVDTNSFSVIAFILAFVLLPADLLLRDFLKGPFAAIGAVGSVIVYFIFYGIAFVSILTILYNLFFLLNKIRAVRRLFTVLSFTHYWRKYRQSDLTIGIYMTDKSYRQETPEEKRHAEDKKI